MTWDERHCKIFTELIDNFVKNGIEYFILRNYKGLPNVNSSKDIDIIIRPGKGKKAEELLRQVYKNNNLTNFHKAQFARLNCYYGISLKNGISIHIDLIEGYIVKGYEIFSFDELYENTESYNGLRVLDEFYEGIMVFIYKQFGYGKPQLKDEYKEIIHNTYVRYKDRFINLLEHLTSKKYSELTSDYLSELNFDAIISLAPILTKLLKKYATRKHLIKTQLTKISFIFQKTHRIIFRYRKFEKSVAIIAPDGAGKTTFLDALYEKINYYYRNNPEDRRFDIYHFRPNILPNLGEIGEKIGIMEQDKDFTNPHRSKAANPFSSLIRILYYWLDYVIGWSICVRKDVQFDRYSVFDRYSYDLIVDPGRSKLNLPMLLRKIFVMLMHHPKIVFYLDAQPETIFKRKQELTLEEIRRQTDIYRNLAGTHSRFVVLDANESVDSIVNNALEKLFSTYTEVL